MNDYEHEDERARQAAGDARAAQHRRAALGLVPPSSNGEGAAPPPADLPNGGWPARDTLPGENDQPRKKEKPMWTINTLRHATALANDMEMLERAIASARGMPQSLEATIRIPEGSGNGGSGGNAASLYTLPRGPLLGFLQGQRDAVREQLHRLGVDAGSPPAPPPPAETPPPGFAQNPVPVP